MPTGTLPDRRTGAGEEAYSPIPSELDVLADFRSELQQLTTAQRELLQELRSDAGINLDAEELPRLRKENEELRARVEKLERLLRAAPAGGDAWVERQLEFEKLLEEKSELIRSLHSKMQQSAHGAATTESAASSEAVQPPIQDVEAQRRQLVEDEAALMQQMRDMEMALAKDRAELARQRTELQRQQTDFARELEMAGRDPQLQERLAILRPGQQENLRKSDESGGGAKSGGKGSGLIRRLFG